MLQINNVDFFAHFVDQGRKKAQHFGYSQGGASDWVSFQLANALLGNELTKPALEISLGGLTATATSKLTICISCLAEPKSLQCFIDDIPIDIHMPHDIKPNQKLRVKCNKTVAHWYLSIKHGFDAPVYFDSVSSVAREQAPQMAAPITSGQVLQALATNQPSVSVDAIDIVSRLANLVDYKSKVLSMHYAYQHNAFDAVQKHKFLNSTYQLTGQVGRMGAMLEGRPINTQLRKMYSEGICLGAIQITSSGQPMILMNDRQTIGGYPKIGAIGSVSGAKLSQKLPGNNVCFALTDPESLRLQKIFVHRSLLQIKNRSTLRTLKS